MTPHDDQIVKVLDTPEHGFDDRGFRYTISHAGSWPREVLVDGAPAYRHDETIATAELEHLRRVAPLPFPLGIFLLSHEARSRSNGHYDDGTANGEQIEIGGVKRYPPAGCIVLSAKRIPIHPAMTRYLVSHEYGHGVMYHLARIRGLKDDDVLRGQYLEQCRPEASRAYGCGRWHANVGELFANDFRILVAEREVEYWPHPGHARPEESLAVVGFWARAVKDLLI